MKDKIYHILLKSFETELSKRESSQLERALTKDEPLRKKQEEIRRIRDMLLRQELDFEPFFETRVMAGIEAVKEMFSEQLFFVFRRLALVSLVLIAVITVTTYWQYGSLSFDAIAGLSELNQESAETFLLYGWGK